MNWNSVFVPTSQGLSFYNKKYVCRNAEILLMLFNFSAGLIFWFRNYFFNFSTLCI